MEKKTTKKTKKNKKKLDMCPKQSTQMPLPFANMATTSGCIHFNNYFPNAQSDLLYILTPYPTPGHDSGVT